ncbi:MAG: ATPase, T2SS/T4P/T4SS family [Phycisphaerales bacterium]|nr:ATPase, T2SS/T4P/T4SS family [Phycisphaerales bacterium]
MIDLPILLSDASVLLLSPWKPLIIWAVVASWAWLVATKIQADATFYRFNLEKWNIAFISFAAIGIGVMIFGWIFWVGWPIGLLILLAPVLFYWKLRNEKVPEENRFTISFSKSPEAAERKANKRAQMSVSLKYLDSGNQTVIIPSEKEAGHEVFLVLDSILAPSLEERATRLDLGLSAGGCIATRTIDTVRSKIDNFDTKTGVAVFNQIRLMAGLDMDENRQKQIGMFKVMSADNHYEITIASSGTSKGQLLRIDVDRSQQVKMPYDGLGLLDKQREILDPLTQIQNRRGMVLLSAPPGQGLTTTGYAVMSTHDSYTSNVRTLEIEKQATLEGAVQQVWDQTNPEVDYARTLQSMLRRDPDVVLVTDVDDSATAQVAAESGPKGPLLYMSFSASSTTETISKWVQHVGDLDLATAPLKAIVHQRLVRRLCDNCKIGFVPADSGRLRLPEGTQLYKAGGQVEDRNKIIDCPVCKGNGYLGVTGIFEVMPVSSEVKKCLAEGDLKAAQTAARREKMILMQEAAMQKAVRGITSIEEIKRVLSGEKKKPAPKPTSKPTG